MTEGGFLAEMAGSSRARARALSAGVGRAELERRARAAPPAPALRLSDEGFDLIAEIKFASPAAGVLAHDPGPEQTAERARGYAAAGACALSVLTEPTRFAGSLAQLEAAARAVDVPVMRKDFLVDPLQVLEARAAGAGGVLLVLRLLDEPTLAAMLEEARLAGVFVLLEAFDAADLARAASLVGRARRPQLLVGVNSRDLVTLTVDRGRHRALAPHLPAGIPGVAESGLESSAEVRAAAEAGYRLALVGSALMRAADAHGAARALLAAGRTQGGAR